MGKIINQPEIAESEGIQVIVNHAAIHMVTAVMMAVRDPDVGP